MDLDIKDKRALAILLVFGVIIGYFALSWAGVIPNQYNLIEHYFGENGVTDDNTTANVNVDVDECTVYGIPDFVDVGETNNNTFNIRFVATEGSVGNFNLMLLTYDSPTDAVFTIEANEGGYFWNIAPDGTHAQWQGEPLIPYEEVSVTLHIDGDASTVSGGVQVICSSSGITHYDVRMIWIES